jgi:RNA polymerase sigma-70 factor (ECF subfamily)
MLAPHDRTPSRSAAAHEAVEAIRAALGEIDVDYAEALRLRYAEGLAVENTAERMGRTKAAVHMLCHRGLRRLRDALGRESKFLSRKA